MRTKSEIQAEIEALDMLKPIGPHKIRTRGMIEIAIQELENGVYDKTEKWVQLTAGEQYMAMDARRWKNGEINERPSQGWGDLVE